MNVSVAPKPDMEISLGDGVIMPLQLIPAGSFRMGSRREYEDEEPVHLVHITRPFFLGTYPVTQQEFAVWTRATDIEHANYFADKSNHPAEQLNWHEAMQFCEWLNANGRIPAGHRATLPTEAQREYACRAGTDTEYYSGDGGAALAEAGWYNGNAQRQTQPVGLKTPNAFGLYDMHGNVDEWCRDAWDADAYKKRVDGVADPEVVASEDAEGGTGEDTGRAFRGGSWIDSAGDCRTAIRYWCRSGLRFGYQGFRVCLVPGP